MSDTVSSVTLKLPAGFEIESSTWLWNRLDEVSVALGIVPSMVLAFFARTPDAIPEPTMGYLSKSGQIQWYNDRYQILEIAKSIGYVEEHNPDTAAKQTSSIYLPAGWFTMFINLRPGYTILSTAEMLDKLQLNQ